MDVECSTNSLSTHGHYFLPKPRRRHCSWPHHHTFSFTQTPQRLNTPPPSLGCVMAVDTALRPHRCHSHVAPPICSAFPKYTLTQKSTFIGHPHVPANLVMRRHGSCRVPLPPRGWPTCLRVTFILAHANCLMDCLIYLTDWISDWLSGWLTG